MDALTDIGVFVEVVETGSFTATAEKLGLSRSAVSKYVSRLEERLGAQLLNRTTRRLSLTEAGSLFYERSRHALQEIGDAESEVSRLQGEPRGKLRINAPMSFGVMHVAPAIPEFLALYPELSVDVNFDDRKVDVIEGGFDVSIRISDMADSSLIARRIAPCRHAIVASQAYLERHGTPEHPDQLKDHNIITYQYQDSAHEWQFQKPGEQTFTVPVTGSIQMNNSLGLREALINGAGITRTPTFVVGHDIAEGRLTPILTNYTTLEVSIYLVYARREHLAPKVRAFVDFMKDRISDEPYWDSRSPTR